jgi:hypothetical protein
MHRVFGMNYFVFCFLVLAVVLFFTKEMRDEEFFDMAGVMDQLQSTRAPSSNDGFFGMSPGTLDQLRSTEVPSFCPLPPMSTSMMNPQSTPLNTLIQGNLAKKGIMDMTETSNKNLGFYALI